MLLRKSYPFDNTFAIIIQRYLERIGFVSRFVGNHHIILLISAFCPYLLVDFGLRVDHLVIYGYSYLFVLIYFLNKKEIVKPTGTFLLIWMLASMIFALVTFMGRVDNFMSVIPDLDNILQPLAILVIFGSILSSQEGGYREKLKSVSKCLIILLSLNTIWIFIGFIYNLDAINHYFWRSNVGSLAAQMGRYSGIFNQPAEAGVAYSVGLFAWLYLVESSSKIKIKQILALVMMFIGGIFTISKIFLFGGILVFFFGAMLNRRFRKSIIKILLLFSALAVVPYYYLTKSWDGFWFLMRFFDGTESNSGIVKLITAGRFSSGGNASQQSTLFTEVWDNSPIFGEGFGKYQTVDSAFFSFFSMGGMIGLVLYILILLFFVITSLRFISHFQKSPESKLYLYVTLLIIGGSFGVPVLTINRASIVLLVFIGLLLQHFYSLNILEKNISKKPIKGGARQWNTIIEQ